VSLGVSQERLAFDSGVDRSYVDGLERGDEDPTVEVLECLADTLGVPIAVLVVEPTPDAEPLTTLPRGPRPTKRGRSASES
jgi:transcriptional regulator with XRE-family HTH domain